MKTLLNLVFGAMLASSLACADNFTEKNTDKAKEVIAAAVAAHGGSALIDELKTLCSNEVTIKEQTTIQQIPHPRDTVAALLKAADVILPEALPASGTRVYTRKKLTSER